MLRHKNSKSIYLHFKSSIQLRPEVVYRQPSLQGDWIAILIEIKRFRWAIAKLLSAVGRFLPQPNFAAASTIQTTKSA